MAEVFENILAIIDPEKRAYSSILILGYAGTSALRPKTSGALENDSSETRSKRSSCQNPPASQKATPPNHSSVVHFRLVQINVL